MKLEKTAAIAEIVSSIAIVVTLAYLAIQTQQNTRAINAGALQALFGSGQQELEFLASNPDIEMLYWKESLSAEESVRLSLSLIYTLRGKEHTWIQFNNGVIDRISLDSLNSPIPSILSSRRARMFWESTGQDEFEPGFVAYVNNMLENVLPQDRSRLLMFEDDAH